MLRVASDGPVLRVTLARPEVRNAFNDELIAQLTATFTSVPQGTRVVVLAGEGKAFCAGGDLEWMRRTAGYSEEENTKDALALAGMFCAVATCPALVITRVHGAAFGGGLGLIAASDMSFATPDTKFSFSEVRLGLIPATIATYVVPKIGLGHARALFASGEIFGVERAEKIGLIHEATEAIDQAIELRIDQVLQAGPEAVAAAKALVLDWPLTPEETARRLARTRAGDEAREGIGAFLDKRRPCYFVERDSG